MPRAPADCMSCRSSSWSSSSSGEVSKRIDSGGGSCSRRLAELSGELLVRALDLKDAGSLEYTDQDEEQATYAEKISPEERRLDPSRSAEELEGIVRALTPHIGAHLELEDGSRLGVRRAVAVNDGPPAGEMQARDAELLLGTAEGALRLEAVQPPGGKPMPAGDFLRGAYMTG